NVRTPCTGDRRSTVRERRRSSRSGAHRLGRGGFRGVHRGGAAEITAHLPLLRVGAHLDCTVLRLQIRPAGVARAGRANRSARARRAQLHGPGRARTEDPAVHDLVRAPPDPRGHVLEVISGKTHGRDLSIDCDAVVIGSGAGGAVVATHLAEAGRSVVILEEGPYLPAHEHGQLRQTESLRKVWRDAGATFAIGVGGSPEINVTTGRGVGGSSALTGGVCFRTHDHVLEEWSNEGMPELSPKEMDRWYSIVENDVHVETVPIEMR